MSVELVNRITIKKGNNVFVSHHSNNDNSSFHSSRMDYLSTILAENGSLGLKTELVKQFYENWQAVGNHKSILPYKEMQNKIMTQNDYNEMILKLNKIYNELTEKDKETEYKVDKTKKMKFYLTTQKYQFEKFYQRIAKRIELEE